MNAMAVEALQPAVELGPEPTAAWRRLGRAGPNGGEMELLRAATLDEADASAAWRRWIARHVLDVAHHRSTDLLPAVAANLPAAVLADEAERLRGIRRRVWADNQFGFAGVKRAIVALRARGIEPVLAKGGSLATTVYAEPGTRVMHDVDLLIGPERFDDALDALDAAGWRQMDAVEGPFFHAVAMADENGGNVDVHRWVVFPRFTPVPEASWIERAIEHEILAVPVHRLDGSDELVLAILHGMLTNSDSASRWPIDVVMLARSVVGRSGEAADFWDRVVDSTQELRVGPVVADGLAMCITELAAPVPDGVIERLTSGPLDAGLRIHWSLCRRGITPEWRLRRFMRLERSQGRRPTIGGYVRPRWNALRTRGSRDVLSGRIGRLRIIVSNRFRS